MEIKKVEIDKGQAFDLGTGTGVIPRGMYKYGGQWFGTDNSRFKWPCKKDNR